MTQHLKRYATLALRCIVNKALVSLLASETNAFSLSLIFFIFNSFTGRYYK